MIKSFKIFESKESHEEKIRDYFFEITDKGVDLNISCQELKNKYFITLDFDRGKEDLSIDDIEIIIGLIVRVKNIGEYEVRNVNIYYSDDIGYTEETIDIDDSISNIRDFLIDTHCGYYDYGLRLFVNLKFNI